MDRETVAVGAALITALNLGPLAIKYFRSKSDKLVDKKVQAETTKYEIESLKSVVEGVRSDHAALRVENLDLRSRVSKLEERERHMLTRVAVHEAWDQIAFRALLQNNPDHPPPPPLHDPADLVAAEHEHLMRLEMKENEG